MQRPSPVTRYLALALLPAMSFAPRLHAAESYDSCTGFIDSIPATISTQGVWCLRKDLSTAITSGKAITIAANNVTIDSNRFKLGGLAAGNGSMAMGIYSDSRQQSTVRNCNVRGFLYGILLDGYTGGGHLVEDNRLDNNLLVGIHVLGPRSLVRRNIVVDTGGSTSQPTSIRFGIHVNADVIDNQVDTVYASAGDTSVHGIYLSDPAATARNNRVRDLVSSGTGYT